MNANSFAIIFSIFSFFLSNCDGNYSNIIIRGRVTDCQHNQDISNVKIKIKCWVYSLKNWESFVVEQTVYSDKKGEFFVKFKDGEALDFEFTRLGFEKKEKSITLKKNSLQIDTCLEVE